MAASSDPFVESLAQVRWFANIGQSLQEEGVVRLSSCSDWPGPEDSGVDAFFSEHQRFKENLEASFGSRRAELLALWDIIHSRVLEAAGPVIGLDPAEDAWHGPSTATWHAAFAAGLVAWCQALQYPVPDWLAQQWAWFGRGRWPAGFASLDENGIGRGLLVL
jgi:hypothetical protein